MNSFKLTFITCFCFFLAGQLSAQLLSVDVELTTTYPIGAPPIHHFTSTFTLTGSEEVPLNSIRKVVFEAKMIDDHNEYNIQPWEAEVNRDSTFTVEPDPNDPYVALITCLIPANTIMRSEAQVMLVAGGGVIRCDYYGVLISRRTAYIEYEKDGVIKTMTPKLMSYFSDPSCARRSDFKRLAQATETKTKAYPNPTNASFLVESPTNSRIQVFSPNGQLMREATTLGGQTNFDTSNWPSGIYFVRILNGDTNEMEQHKLSVIH